MLGLVLAVFLVSGQALAQNNIAQEKKAAQEKTPPVEKAKTPKKPQINLLMR